MSYDAVRETVLLHLVGGDDSRFTIVQALTCLPDIHDISNLTNEDAVTTRRPVQVHIYLQDFLVELKISSPNRLHYFHIILGRPVRRQCDHKPTDYLGMGTRR